jgi:Holliday junction resolvasome RuvABC DNA-binding subunit
MSKTMPLEKATKLLNLYTKNNYNAYKTFKEMGYSEHTCKTATSRLLKSAQKTVLKNKTKELEQDTKVSTREQVKNSLDILGVSEEMVKERLKFIAFDTTDYTNAIKILQLLSKDIGLNISDSETQKTPAVSLTLVKSNGEINAVSPDSIE